MHQRTLALSLSIAVSFLSSACSDDNDSDIKKDGTPTQKDSSVSTKWFNAKYKYKRDITKETTANIPSLINDINGSFDHHIWTNARQGDMSIYFNSKSDFAVVANDSTLAAHRVEGGTGGNKPTDVFPAGLDMAYQFDKTGSIQDSTSLGYHGKTSNTTWSKVGKIGGGLLLDGTKPYNLNGYKQVNGKNLQNGWTLTLWLKIDKLKEGPGGPMHNFIAGAFDALGDNQHGVYILIKSKTEIQIILGGEKGSVTDVLFAGSGVALADGKWKHFSIVHDIGTAAKNLMVYVDGTALSPSSISDSATKYDDAGYPWHFLSAIENSTGTIYQGISGTVDEINLWSLALSAKTIKEIYENGAGLNMLLGPIITRP